MMRTIEKRLACAVIAVGTVVTAPVALAGVSAAEAAKLKKELTPMGAERAGNKEGTIPEWTGGYTTAIPGFKNGGRRPDPFAAEKPLFSITGQNMAQYADKLTDGTKAMLKRHPSYRVDVYPSHRTMAAPQWIYDNSFKNATRSKLVEGPAGPAPEGAYGGVPFPIPSSGAEVMWNHLLRWRGSAFHFDINQYVVTSDGKRVLVNDSGSTVRNPYHQENGSPERWNGSYYDIRLTASGPPLRAGEAILARVNADDEKTGAWIYLVGQRRVRKLPNPCCDTPAPQTSGIMMFDEMEVFQGRLGRFDWELLGKREMFVPYNSNRTLVPKRDEDLIGANHLNPDHVRWELHRVWVVEAKLKAGQRHTSPRSVFYVDEDSWHAVLADRWDARGQLSRTLWQIPYVMSDLPAVTTETFGLYDLQNNSWYANGIFNSKSEQYMIVPYASYTDAMFTPDAMAGEGVR